MSPRPGSDVTNSSEFSVIGAVTAERAVIADHSAVERAVREHPALTFALVYGVLTIVAVTHEVWFFQAFRIDILAYAELDDMLSAPLRNALSVLLSLVPGLLLLWFGELRLRRTGPKGFTSLLGKHWRNPAWRLGTYAVSIFLYAILFAQLDASRMSDRVKGGHGQRVTFARNDGAAAAERPIMLGSTAHFFFLYYPDRKVTEIVPIENLNLVTVEARSRRERRADSLAAAPRVENTRSGTTAAVEASLSP
jgi:hypothetical protein